MFVSNIYRVYYLTVALIMIKHEKFSINNFKRQKSATIRSSTHQKHLGLNEASIIQNIW